MTAPHIGEIWELLSAPESLVVRPRDTGSLLDILDSSEDRIVSIDAHRCSFAILEKILLKIRLDGSLHRVQEILWRRPNLTDEEKHYLKLLIVAFVLKQGTTSHAQ